MVRPLNSGWRHFPSRDAGISGLADIESRRIYRSGPASLALGSATGLAMRPICVLTMPITGSLYSRPLDPAFSPSNTRSRTSIC